MVTTPTFSRRVALWAATVAGTAAMVTGGWSITHALAATHPPVRVVAAAAQAAAPAASAQAAAPVALPPGQSGAAPAQVYGVPASAPGLVTGAPSATKGTAPVTVPVQPTHDGDSGAGDG